MSAPMIDPATVYEECRRVTEENAKLRSLLEKAANHIESLGDTATPILLRAAVKKCQQ